MREERTCTARFPTAGLRRRQTLSALPARMGAGTQPSAGGGTDENYCCPGSNCTGARACALACVGGIVDTGLRVGGSNRRRSRGCPGPQVLLGGVGDRARPLLLARLELLGGPG